MAAPRIKTKTAGIYKRGSRYQFSYRIDGRQVWESARTLDDAKLAKAARVTDADRGELDGRSRVLLCDYLREWVERYQGTGRRGYRQETRDEDRRLLEHFALRYFKHRKKLTEVMPRDVAEFVAWLCDPQKQGGRSWPTRPSATP